MKDKKGEKGYAMANGEITASTLGGAGAGVAGGPIGIGVGAAVGFGVAKLGGLFGKKKKAPPKPKPKPFWTPAHIALISTAIVGGVFVFLIIRKK